MNAPGRLRRDVGSGTVLVIGLVAVVALLALSLGTVAVGYQARSRAQTAADLAALAGANALDVPRGVEVAEDARLTTAPCARAGEAAHRNGARVVACRAAVRGVLSVTVRLAHPSGVRAQARAGPAWTRD